MAASSAGRVSAAALPPRASGSRCHVDDSRVGREGSRSTTPAGRRWQGWSSSAAAEAWPSGDRSPASRPPSRRGRPGTQEAERLPAPGVGGSPVGTLQSPAPRHLVRATLGTSSRGLLPLPAARRHPTSGRRWRARPRCSTARACANRSSPSVSRRGGSRPACRLPQRRSRHRTRSRRRHVPGSPPCGHSGHRAWSRP